MPIPFVIQALLTLVAFVLAAGVLLALLELSNKALDDQALNQFESE